MLVARSHSATGPFETLAGVTRTAHSAILQPNTRWGVPGHNCIVSDAAGQDWMVYHAVDLDRDRMGEQVASHGIPRVMCIDRVQYRDGWPYVGDGTPSTTAQAAPITTVGDEQLVQ